MQEDNNDMTEDEHRKYRILTYIKREKMISRGALTRQGLARFPGLNMSTFYSFVNALESDGLIATHKEHRPTRRGPNPVIYAITDLGLAWLKVENKKVKELLRKLA